MELDAAILLWLQSVRCGWMDVLMKGWSLLGNAGLVWICLSLALLLFRRTRKAGLLALFAMLLGLICTNGILKHLVARERPWLVVEGLVPLLAEPDPYSFPSGHTSAAFAAAVVWCRTLPKPWMRVLPVIGAALMGISRLYVGVHFPTDVLAGAVLGTLYALAILWVVRRICNARTKECRH